MISFARILVLDPALLSIVRNTKHLGCVSVWCHMELFEELCSRNEAFRLLVPFQKGSMESEILLDELCPPAIYSTHQKRLKFIDFLCDKERYFYQLYGIGVYLNNSGLIGIPAECP